MNVEFLSVADVEAIHALHLAAHGGSAGVRDRNLLDSAVAQPAATFGGEYLHEDLFAMAAAYLFHLAKNHPFVDGNKRAALAAALTFLDINGIAIDLPTPRLYDATMAVAEGKLGKDELAGMFRELAGRGHDGPGLIASKWPNLKAEADQGVGWNGSRSACWGWGRSARGSPDLLDAGERIARRTGRRIDLKWAVVRDGDARPVGMPSG